MDPPEREKVKRVEVRTLERGTCRHANLPALRLRWRQRLVGVPGLEPGTSSLSGMRSNQLSYTPDRVGLPEPKQRRAAFRHAKIGGGRRDRTDDLLNANQALSQLSYAPGKFVPLPDRHFEPEMVRLESNNKPKAIPPSAASGRFGMIILIQFQHQYRAGTDISLERR